VAASSVDAHKRAAGGTKFWTRLMVAGTAKNSARCIFQAIDALLPLIRNRQSASLRAARCIPIIPELDCGLRKRDAGGFQGLCLQTLR